VVAGSPFLRGPPEVAGTYRYALNTHDSQLLRFDTSGQLPKATWQTRMNPVALATRSDGGTTKVLVLGGATHALAIHDASAARPTSGSCGPT